MTQVKICGMTTPGAVDAAITAGADYLGFVIFPKSPRHLALAIAEVLVERVAGRAKTVALLVEPDDVLLETVVARLKPDVVQLHGRETVERVAQVKRSCGLAVWKAVSVQSHVDVAAAKQFVVAGLEENGDEFCANLILYDAKPPRGVDALPGGNGLAFDWRILSGIENGGVDVKRPFVLAGGLSPSNVGAAVALLNPAIVDVSSSVESAPGTKDPELIESFIRAAKAKSRA